MSEEAKRIVATAVEVLEEFGVGEEEALLLIAEEAMRLLMEVCDEPLDASQSAR